MTTSGAAAKVQHRSYLPVPLDLFVPDQALNFTVYVRREGDTLVPVCPKGGALGRADLDAWQRDGMAVRYVDTSEHRAYQSFAQATMDRLGDRQDLPTARKAELCYRVTRELVKDAVDSCGVESVVGDRRRQWTENLVALICADEAAVHGMLSMLSHDYYTYTHMVNVSVMVTSLAYRLGDRDPDRLKMLAGGGLLHDVGKLRISPDVLNKTGRLTPDECEEIRSHPGLGLSVLVDRKDVRPQELLMVQQHHEKLDGSGYPSGLVRSEISVEAQMTTVVDIYDALTCKRPYRPAMSAAKAMAILDDEAAAKINPDMLAAWKEVVRLSLETEGHGG